MPHGFYRCWQNLGDSAAPMQASARFTAGLIDRLMEGGDAATWRGFPL